MIRRMILEALDQHSQQHLSNLVAVAPVVDQYHHLFVKELKNLYYDHNIYHHAEQTVHTYAVGIG